jgi:hypothetical protein
VAVQMENYQLPSTGLSRARDRCHHLCQLSSVANCTVYCCCLVVDVAAAGVLEIARTGRIALTRESGVDTKFLESMRSSTRIF